MIVLPAHGHLLITGWQDILEILFYVSACYYVSAWLKKDTQTPLLTTAYSYCALLFISYAVPLQSLYAALITFAPLVVAILIMMHKESLQKSFVALHRITPAKKSDYDWTQELIRTALVSMNNHISLSFMIEKKQALDDLVYAEYRLNSSLSNGLTQLLLEHTHAPESFIWLDNHGIVHSYDCTLALSSIDTWLAQEATHYTTWLQHALIFSTKTDALFITTEPTSRTFTIIQNGTKQTLVSAGKTLELLKKHTGVDHYPEQGESHEYVNLKKSSIQKLQP